MNKRERVSAVNKIIRAMEKSNKLSTESGQLKKDSQKALDKLAKKTAPYKRGHVFRKVGSSIYVKVNGVSGMSVQYSRKPDKNYHKGPYCLDCRRCSSKGITGKHDKWFFIYGPQIGDEWEDCGFRIVKGERVDL